MCLITLSFPVPNFVPLITRQNFSQAISDINIWGPNSFGVIIGCIQIALRLYYGTREKPGRTAGTDAAGGKSAGDAQGVFSGVGGRAAAVAAAEESGSMQELGLAMGGRGERMDSDKMALLSSFTSTALTTSVAANSFAASEASAMARQQWSPLEAGSAGKPPQVVPPAW